MAGVLLPAQRMRIRKHLGYPLRTTSASLSFGLPVPRQTNFLVELALDQVQADSVNDILDISNKCDELDQKIFEATCTLKVDKVDTITLAGASGETGLVTDRLRKEKEYWVGRLGEMLGVPPFELRQTKKFSSTRAINRKVVG